MSWNERLLKWRRRWWRRRQSLHRRRLSSTAAFRSPSKCEREEKVLQLAFVCVRLWGWVCGRICEVEERVREKERKRFALSLLHCTIISCSAINSISLSLSLSLSLLLSLSCYYFNSHSPRHMHTHTRKAFMLSRALLSLLLTHEHICSAMSTIKALYLTLTQAHWWTSTGAHTHMHTHVHTLRRTHTHAHTHTCTHRGTLRRTHTLTLSHVQFLFHSRSLSFRRMKEMVDTKVESSAK